MGTFLTLTILEKIRLDWKVLPWTNTLAYLFRINNDDEKGFLTLATESRVPVCCLDLIYRHHLQLLPSILGYCQNCQELPQDLELDCKCHSCLTQSEPRHPKDSYLNQQVSIYKICSYYFAFRTFYYHYFTKFHCFLVK
jgi:hypothetical protein